MAKNVMCSILTCCEVLKLLEFCRRQLVPREELFRPRRGLAGRGRCRQLAVVVHAVLGLVDGGQGAGSGGGGGTVVTAVVVG